jgi:hypothetical protein
MESAGRWNDRVTRRMQRAWHPSEVAAWWTITAEPGVADRGLDFRLKAEATRDYLSLVASGFSRTMGGAILIQLIHATS